MEQNEVYTNKHLQGVFVVGMILGACIVKGSLLGIVLVIALIAIADNGE